MDNKSLNIAYIGGGSRAWAWTFMTDLALEAELGGNLRLYDIDGEAAENNAILGSRISDAPEATGKWRYVVSPTLPEALAGADFVIISILPGTFAEMRSDVHLRERLGVFQSVGDTAGPGGMIRGLRIIPAFREFAYAIRDYAPNAWVINYTNPMSLCVRALYHFFPKIKAFGCCHEVFGMQELLAAMCRLRGVSENAARSDIHVNVLGLNHFTWFDKASFLGYDLFEMYADFVDEFCQSGFSTDNSHMPDVVFTSINRVKFDLFRKYGLMAAAGDRHLAEFMRGDLYLKDPETVRSWGFYLTSVDWREQDLKRRLNRSAALVSGKEEIVLKKSGEEGILLLKALCGLGRVVSNVNLPNTFLQISNLPPETVVESNALFSYNDVRPVTAGALPDNIFELIKPHIKNQSEILRAAVNFDREAVYGAFSRDPLLAGRCSDKDIRTLADDMIANTLTYLAEEWRQTPIQTERGFL